MLKLEINGKDYDLVYDIEELCAKYSHLDHALIGETVEGETIMISINKGEVITEVYQDNGWVRKNIYYLDGSSEELYNHGNYN